MAVRVRKLAKEMRRGPTEILGLLHALGHVKYRSPEDMLPEPIVHKVRQAARQGVEPVRVEPVAVPAGPADAQPEGEAEDLMSRLVPGVVRKDARPVRPVPRARPEPELVEAPIAAIATPEADEAVKEALGAEREAHAAARRALADATQALRQAREELHREREAAAHLEAELADARAAVREEGEDRAAQAAPELPRLLDLLEKRGLRGLDEAERALASLAEVRLLRDAIPALRVDRPEGLVRLLDERLVLVGGEIPPALRGSLAAVTVAPERGELPGVAALGRQLERVGELLLLHGVRRLRVVGGRPAWHRLLREGLDPRVEVEWMPGSPRGRAEAEADIDRTDAVVLWQIPVHDEAREVYASSRAQLVEVGAADPAAMLAALQEMLEQS